MATSDLLELHHRLSRQHRWLEHRWRATEGDAQIVMQLLRLWVEGSAVASELKRRLPAQEDDNPVGEG